MLLVPQRRERLRRARLMLLFTPSLCEAPLDALDAALPHVDVVQVRVKSPEHAEGAAPAAELFEWTSRVVELVTARPGLDPLIIVNDRVDVAAVLTAHGVDGVHLGADDCPPATARELLGPEPLIGLSTHDQRAVARADDHPIDYVGFGPVHATRTKGYERGLGAEAAWIADSAAALPLFPIGGIDATNAGELAPVGRAAVASAILCAEDPGRAAADLRGLLRQ